MKYIVQLVLRLFGLGLIGSSFWFAATEEMRLDTGRWLHIPSLVFVLGVISGILFVSFQWSRVKNLFRNLCFSSVSSIENDVNRAAGDLKDICDEYYARGANALRERLQTGALPPIWRKVLSQLESKIPPADIRSLVQYDAHRFEQEAAGQLSILSSLSAIAPSVGLLGTVVGLIRLLSNLSDISTIGSHMALALVTALYGIMFSVVVFNPLVSRMQALRDINLKAFQQALFWLHLIESRKPSFYLEDSGIKSNET